MQGIIWKRPLLSYTFFVFYLPYLLQFRKSRSCVLLPIPFTPVICLAPNILFCFSNHQGAVFFFLLFSHPSSVLYWHKKVTISSQNMTNPIFFFCVGYYLEVEVSFSIRSRICSLVTFSDPFFFSILQQAPHLKAFQILPLQFP